MSLGQRQRGAAGLFAVLFLIMVISILSLVTLRLASTSVNDSLMTHDGVAALYLAESGLERAAGQLATATACGALLAGSWTYAGGTVSITNLGAGFTTDFDGTALPAGQCRVQSNGTTGLFSAQRSIEGIIALSGGNVLGSANSNFNAPAGACSPPGCYPTGWTLPAGGWDDFGGVGGSRAAYVEKLTTGSSTSTTAGQFAMSAFNVTAPATLTLNFDYKHNTSGGGGQRLEFTFRVHSGATTYTADAAPFQTSHTGVFQNGSVTFTIGGSGPVNIDAFTFDMVATGGQPKLGWLDNLVLTSSGGGSSTASIIRWRERTL